jgi:hypothetical protein
MKKYLFLTILVMFFNNLYSQNSKDSLISFSKVVVVDSDITAEELYDRARTWFAIAFKDGKEVVQLEDKEQFKLIGKGGFKYNPRVYIGSDGSRGYVSYTITIQVKDNRYRYILTNFYHEGNTVNQAGQFSFGYISSSEECTTDIAMTSKSWRNKVWKDIKIDIDNNAKQLISSLEKSMKTPTNKLQDDW